jgi:hypothetical protein
MKMFMISFFLVLSNCFANEKGNGGDPIEMRAKAVLLEINSFFDNPQNQKDFPEIDFTLFNKAISAMNPVVTDDKLKDKFGTTRCLINDQKVIFINRKCWQENLKNEQDHFAILFHEVLGEIGLEVAGEYIASQYPISARLQKYVQRINRYGLVTPNRGIALDHIILSCSRRDESIEMLISFKKGKNKRIEVRTAHGKRRWHQYIFKKNGEYQEDQSFKRTYDMFILKKSKNNSSYCAKSDDYLNSCFSIEEKTFRLVNSKKEKTFYFSLSSFFSQTEKYRPLIQVIVYNSQYLETDSASVYPQCFLSSLSPGVSASRYYKAMIEGKTRGFRTGEGLTDDQSAALLEIFSR